MVFILVADMLKTMETSQFLVKMHMVYMQMEQEIPLSMLMVLRLTQQVPIVPTVFTLTKHLQQT